MLSLPKLFTSGMVMQRQKPILIWGNAAPDELVTVCMRHHKTGAAADKAGFWRAELPAMEASTAETLTVSAGGERIELTDIAIGELWIAGGQSNMEFWMRYEKHRELDRTVILTTPRWLSGGRPWGRSAASSPPWGTIFKRRCPGSWMFL